jgi:2-oxoglutarate ferredoxin oxidoreductase subunit beta
MGPLETDYSSSDAACEYLEISSYPESLREARSHFCPGCTHGLVHRLIGEIIDELGARERAVCVAPVGCAVFAYDYFRFDVCEAPHGRTPCVATGIKRVHPEHLVFSYQGDGDLAAIGCGEIMHTANRGENITVIFINNGVYGMTGGQMAPTTLPGQKTLTTPAGRSPLQGGHPMNILDMIALTPGAAFVARTCATSPKNVVRCKRMIRKAFAVQEARAGFAIVEVLGTCPVGWHMTPLECNRRIDEEVVRHYPLKVLKDTSGLAD